MRAIWEAVLVKSHMVSKIFIATSIAALLSIPSATLAQSRGTGARNGANVSGVEMAHSVDCQGRPATVSGTDNRITFSGDCPGLTVSGTDNEIHITLRPGATIQVSGVDNTVIWRVSGQGRPRVSVSGVGNRVAAAR